MCNRVGFAATLALAIDSLPAADAKLQLEAEKLCEFIHKNCRPDGSIQYTDGAGQFGGSRSRGERIPGAVLLAIIAGTVCDRPRGNLMRSSGPWPITVLYQARPHPLLAATLTPAFAELFLQTRMHDAAVFVFDLNDTLCRYQIQAGDPRLPQWIGGFRSVANNEFTDVPSGPETGCYLQSLSFARQVARQADLDRHGKYTAASQEAIQYLTDLQYVETNTRHFETSFRVNMLMGAFHLSPSDGNIRIDATATAVTGMVQFLMVASEKN